MSRPAPRRRNSASAATSCDNTPLPSLDLHFCKRDQALRLLTMFLEEQQRQAGQNSRWCTVITGSGKHSQEGPVLRDAVQSLLERREMIFYLNRPGKGSFTVNFRSGFALTKPPLPVDTKLIVKDRNQNEEDDLSRFRQAQKNAVSSPQGSPTATNALLEAGRYYPRPAEVAADDAQLHEAQRLSLEEERRLLKQKHQENKLFRRALSESALEEQQLQQHEQELLERALVNSQLEQQNQDNELEKALSLSEQEHQIEKEREKKMLELILERSTREVQYDDDAVLQHALEVSQHTSVRAEVEEVDEDLFQALKLSLSE